MVERCANCGFPLMGEAGRYLEGRYCCAACQQGGPCQCTYTVARDATASRRPAGVAVVRGNVNAILTER